MQAGLTVYNDNNIVQIDQDYVNQRAPQQKFVVGRQENNYYELASFGLDMRVECPIVFVRSTGFVGNFQLVPANSGSAPYPRGSMQFYSETTTEIAVCSVNNSPTRGNYGLEVFDQNGKYVYGSLDLYPQISKVAELSGSSVSNSVFIPGSNNSDWFCINPITPGLSRPLGAGSDASFPPYILMCRLLNGTMSIKFQENGSLTFPLAPNTSLSPYNGRTIRVPVAKINYQ